ncbi:hypothetical protein HPB50_011451 [Hyalomma asiaticum]|uniref:Uncharacterized protein n=1 Tax=Hyalomma asiaticum TaxID=266040 RepID=A0ACB7SQ64_HYAAI|nr:hypothetical protein HPB50_011451 [Hyalomma asiaticum]
MGCSNARSKLLNKSPQRGTLHEQKKKKKNKMTSTTNSPRLSVSKMNGQQSRSPRSRKESSPILDVMLAAEMARDKSQDSTKSTAAKSTQMRSAQALSFWSMYSSVAAHINPTRFITVADLACAVATVLAIAVLILSLTMFVDRSPSGGSKNVLVKGSFGRVLGISHKVFGHTDVYAFLGVPYAHPPVGELRFRRTFTDYGISVARDVDRIRTGLFSKKHYGARPQALLINATAPKPACVQSSRDESLSEISEDCLHLSIWTTSRECNQPDCANKAVLVFLHDGFFQTGGNRQPLYDGKYALAVAANLNVPLLWYLAAYGDVVVVLPNYRLGALGFMNDGTGSAPGNAGLYDQLLALEWTRRNIGTFGGNVSNLVLVGYGAGAAAAGYLLLGRAAGKRISDAEILLGHMDDESPLAKQFARLVVVQQERLSDAMGAADTILEALNISRNTVRAIVSKNSTADHWETMGILTNLLADLLVTCPVRDMGRLLASAGKNRVFRYLVSTNSAANATAARAGDMLRLLFGAHFLSPVELAAWRHASEAIIGFWTHFARTGSVPNSNERGQGRFSISIAAERETSVLDIRKKQCQQLSSLNI